MKKSWIALIVIAVILLILVGRLIGTYNTLVTMEENVNQAWAQVDNQYQRRADLIPNLVETVKGYASHEQETFQAVTEARAKVGQISVSPEVLENPQAFQRYQQAQSQLGSVLSRLMAVAENYPQLKANENFLSLQAQLEGTENRIATERRRFNQAVQQFNTKIRRFPTRMIAGMFGFEKKVYFEAEQGAEQVPEVKF